VVGQAVDLRISVQPAEKLSSEQIRVLLENSEEPVANVVGGVHSYPPGCGYPQFAQNVNQN
jgi:hypothetical protein